jgi:predicted AlkP superfamily pyrophosphatase or phosphodiesterase
VSHAGGVPSFAALPDRIAQLTREHERVALILLDAFGMRFVERHASHPLLKRLEIEPVASQFPSTTTAHLTTLYTGLPVEQHGLYEWRVYEPLVDDVIRALPFLGSDDAPIQASPREIVPRPSFYERLEVPSTVLQPAHIWPSRYGSAAFAGATVVAFKDLAAGVRQLGAPGFSYLYWDAIDAAGHQHGPSSAQFDAAAIDALNAIQAALPNDTLLLITADHGQVDVHPDRLDELDVIWPELRLRRPPAGSARDCFLHVDEPERVVAELQDRLEDRATVRPARELFDDIGPRLDARLGDVCVLPAPGRMAWLRAFPSHERRFRGHHGGLTPAESETWLGVAST